MCRAVIRRAIISVFDKTGIADFARRLEQMGVEILSSGGTAKAIARAGVEVTDIAEITGMGDILGHRVVTLHPKVHGAILAIPDDPDHQEDMAKLGIEPVDLVCVGLYPFAQTIADGCTADEAIEMIDIGGPAMVRAAAKNHKYVTVITDPGQYELVLEEMAASDGAVSLDTRRELARQAFALTAAYDVAVSTHLAEWTGTDLPEQISFSFTKVCDLRYGENPHQNAAFYRSDQTSEPCLAQADQIGGLAMSFVNYYDANGALELIKEFDQPAVAIIKHANPAGCAIDQDIVEAYRKAYFGDVNACMGGIIAVNRSVTAELATAIVQTYQRWGKDRGAGGFLAHVIVAPAFEDQAVEIVKARKGWGGDVRLLAVGDLTGRRSAEKATKYVVGGMLVQDRDLMGANEERWTVVTKRRPSPAQTADVRFAWLVCKHVKSNAIVLAKDLAMLGAGAGQMSRVSSAELAVKAARAYGGGQDVDPAGCVFASDAFLPFADSLARAAEIGATAVIQPGGAKKDQEVIDRADELGLAMIFTGARHFNH